MYSSEKYEDQKYNNEKNVCIKIAKVDKVIIIVKKHKFNN